MPLPLLRVRSLIFYFPSLPSSLLSSLLSSIHSRFPILSADYILLLQVPQALRFQPPHSLLDPPQPDWTVSSSFIPSLPFPPLLFPSSHSSSLSFPFLSFPSLLPSSLLFSSLASWSHLFGGLKLIVYSSFSTCAEAAFAGVFEGAATSALLTRKGTQTAASTSKPKPKVFSKAVRPGYKTVPGTSQGGASSLSASLKPTITKVAKPVLDVGPPTSMNVTFDAVASHRVSVFRKSTNEYTATIVENFSRKTSLQGVHHLFYSSHNMFD